MLRIVTDMRIDTGGVNSMGCVICSLKNRMWDAVVMKVIFLVKVNCVYVGAALPCSFEDAVQFFFLASLQ